MLGNEEIDAWLHVVYEDYEVSASAHSSLRSGYTRSMRLHKSECPLLDAIEDALHV